MSYTINKDFSKTLSSEVSRIMDDAVSMRRHIHMHPETGFDTHDTEKFVKKHLNEYGIEIIPSEIGVMGIIHGKDSSCMVALRADMDALCLQEENDVPYRSKEENKMHACGHDGHTSMLLSASRILQKHHEELPMDVLLIFQPAEEGPNLGGARVMLADMKKSGIADKIVNIYGLHLFNDYCTGKIGVKHGALASSTDEFYIKIIGKGGHAGQPNKCVDALSISAKFVTAMESFMSRRIDPFDSAIFSIGILRAGSAINIVAETAQISGTIRCQNNDTRAFILENMEKIANGICDTFGATCSIDVLHGLPCLVNDDKAVDYAQDVLSQEFGQDAVFEIQNPMMGAEDFAYFAEEIPASFCWIGSRNEAKGFTYLAHHPRFDFDEEAMAYGIRTLCTLAYNQK